MLQGGGGIDVLLLVLDCLPGDDGLEGTIFYHARVATVAERVAGTEGGGGVCLVVRGVDCHGGPPFLFEVAKYDGVTPTPPGSACWQMARVVRHCRGLT